MNPESHPNSAYLPDRVNQSTLDLCRVRLKEPAWKASLRIVYTAFIKYRYQINPLGDGFRWGYR